jgi:hypothetical protein
LASRRAGEPLLKLLPRANWERLKDWLNETDIATLERQHGIELVPRDGNNLRIVIGHIDFASVRAHCALLHNQRGRSPRSIGIAGRLKASVIRW